MDADELTPPIVTFDASFADPPICPACGVTMVPADLSELDTPGGDWVCLECEETGTAHG